MAFLTVQDMAIFIIEGTCPDLFLQQHTLFKDQEFLDFVETMRLHLVDPVRKEEERLSRLGNGPSKVLLAAIEEGNATLFRYIQV